MNHFEPEQPVLFISDAHLGGFNRKKNGRLEQELLLLVDYCQRKRIRLAILGDLFDYWMEYPNYTPALGKQVLDRFEEYHEQVGPSLFITGNHDNWTRGHLPNRGFLLIHEYQEISVNQHKILLLHGDGLADPSFDLPRPLSHQLLRNERFVTFYQRIFPPSLGIRIMKYFSRLKRRLDPPDEQGHKLTRWAGGILKATDIDIIICGHDHIPRRKHFSFGTYINLGTFYQHRTMALYNNDKLSLVQWEYRKQSLRPFDHKNHYNTSILNTINE